jgi:sugar-specific transcriptional regulator TrmB
MFIPQFQGDSNSKWQQIIDNQIDMVCYNCYMNDDKTGVLDLLLSLGISRNEALTYIALLSMESVSIRKVADVTGINRGTTYEAIKSLVTQGLVSVRQTGKREYYTAESPDRIYDIIRDKRRDLLDVSNAAKDIIPNLLAEKATSAGRPLVRYYQDDDGVVTILKDVLQTCRQMPKPMYYTYSSSYVSQYLYRKFPAFTERRIAEGIYVKVIAVGEGGEIAAESERKWLANPPVERVSSYTLIYGNKMAVISISKDETPYGVVIEDSGVANMQRLLFEQLWSYL